MVLLPTFMKIYYQTQMLLYGSMMFFKMPKRVTRHRSEKMQCEWMYGILLLMES